LLIAQGQKKLDILKKALWEKVTTEIPASILQFHPNLRVFYCD